LGIPIGHGNKKRVILIFNTDNAVGGAVTFARVGWFIRLTRPLFLAGGLLLYSLGVLIAARDGWPLSIPRLLMGQALVTSIQLMTHYINEFYDQEGDRANPYRTWFSGGSGILSPDRLSPRVARTAAAVAAVLAFVFLVLVGWQIPAVFGIGLVGLLVSWFYSAPPLRLVASGWGEAAASLIVALMVPLVGYILQSGGPLNPQVFVVCLPLIFIHFSMLIAFEIPDRQADQSVGKQTLAVRLGPAHVVRLHNFSIFTAFCVILVLSLLHWPGSQYIRWMFPLAVWQVFAVRRHMRAQPANFLSLTLGALGLFAGTAVLWLAGFVSK
jgi:1,4-dihydroxy-2-naphthoate octaprenyltransferase